MDNVDDIKRSTDYLSDPVAAENLVRLETRLDNIILEKISMVLW